MKEKTTVPRQRAVNIQLGKDDRLQSCYRTLSTAKIPPPPNYAMYPNSGSVVKGLCWLE
jgi:hypothetical protein